MLYQGVIQHKANDLTVDTGCNLPRRKSRPLGPNLGHAGGGSSYRKHRCAIRIERRKSSEGRLGGLSEDEVKEISPYDSNAEKEYRVSTNITIGQGCEMGYDVTLSTAAYIEYLTRND